MKATLKGSCSALAALPPASASAVTASASTSPPSTNFLLICSSYPACRLTGRLYDRVAREGRAQRPEKGLAVLRCSPMEKLQRRLAVARGDEAADLVVRGGRAPSVFTNAGLGV